MAVSTAVWGIDIGQCALKALRCRLGEDGESVIADAFDYIEYPKILSEPGAEPAEVIHVAVADDHRSHRWEGAVGPARVEAEVGAVQESHHHHVEGQGASAPGSNGWRSSASMSSWR